MFAILIGVFLIVAALLSKGMFYRSHGPGLGKYGRAIEPHWIPRLLFIVMGLAAILDGIWEIRHH
jgi:hypothetical protein